MNTQQEGFTLDLAPAQGNKICGKGHFIKHNTIENRNSKSYTGALRLPNLYLLYKFLVQRILKNALESGCFRSR